MLTLILLLLGGSVIAYLSLQNVMIVSLNFLDYTIESIPLFYVIIGSMLVGILLSYVIHLINSIFVFFTMHDKDKKIMDDQKQVAELTKRIHQLELENARLEKESDLVDVDEDSI